MVDNDGKGSKGGWTDRDLLVCLLNVVEKSNVTLNFKDCSYPPGRNWNGFKQKINQLKNTFKPEWDAMAAGQAPGDGTGTPKKTATPRKRKAAGEGDAGETANGSPKKRGRPKKKVESEEPEEPEEPEEFTIKEEMDEEDDESEPEV